MAIYLKEIKDAVAFAREEALEEAKKSGSWTRSRGTFLTTSWHGEQCEPRPAANCPEWKGTLKEIHNLIALVEENFPDVDSISIEGGYDAADSYLDLYEDDNYIPQASWWIVNVWERPTEKQEADNGYLD